jgi:uncharacterized protein
VNATECGHFEVAKLLIAVGVDPNYRDGGYLQKTALMRAASQGNTQIADLLIGAGADLNLQCGNKMSSLYIAAKNGHTDVVKMLIAAGAELDQIDRIGNTALK